ncbi:DUF3109 family protein [Marinoscillum sp. MHG1-6]|uniref:DUF3109 family protein n=1 Tax=Marinoscillum sp. MHG1-6 TaxID=2959627 RepID=UPI002157B101|nr:DUF3109 family protein [Marinoscillum sp. MHG1-6]
MIQIGKTLISDDIKEEFFVCDLERCKGACCVEGDLGAPLLEEELPQIEDVVEVVKDYLPRGAIDALEKNGPYLLDEEGDFSTTTIDNKECAFAYYDERGILKCGIEQAHKDGKTDFRKPISCHLYPIRVVKLHDHLALNYDRWQICSPACELGASLKVPVYKFLKEPLIRKFGEVWYQELVEKIEAS